MLEYLLAHLTPIHAVRRNLMIVLGLAILLNFFAINTADFSFLGINFDPQTLNVIIGLLCIFYGLSVAFKASIVMRVYADNRNKLVKEHREQIEKTQTEFNFNIHPKARAIIVEKENELIKVLQVDGNWGNLAVIFEYALPVLLALLLGARLLWLASTGSEASS